MSIVKKKFFSSLNWPWYIAYVARMCRPQLRIGARKNSAPFSPLCALRSFPCWLCHCLCPSPRLLHNRLVARCGSRELPAKPLPMNHACGERAGPCHRHPLTLTLQRAINYLICSRVLCCCFAPPPPLSLTRGDYLP